MKIEKFNEKSRRKLRNESGTSWGRRRLGRVWKFLWPISPFKSAAQSSATIPSPALHSWPATATARRRISKKFDPQGNKSKRCKPLWAPSVLVANRGLSLFRKQRPQWGLVPVDYNPQVIYELWTIQISKRRRGRRRRKSISLSLLTISLPRHKLSPPEQQSWKFQTIVIQ